MCAAAANNKTLVLFCGRPSSSLDDVCLQLFDLEHEDWYSLFTISSKTYKGIGPHRIMGMVGSELYFFGDAESDDDTEIKKDQNTYYAFDFVTKKVRVIGNLPSFSKAWTNDYVVVGNCIYYVSEKVECLNTIDRTIRKDIGECELCYDASAVYYKGCIYCIGPEFQFIDDGFLTSFNIRTKKLKKLKTPPLVNQIQTIAVLNDKFYVIEVFHLRTMAIYTPETDEWDCFTTDGPACIFRGKLIVCNNRLLCVDRMCSIFEYDFRRKRWNELWQYSIETVCYNLHTVDKSFTLNWQLV